MPRALEHDAGQATRAGAGKGWCARISDHVAYALLAFTGINIFYTMTQLKGEGGTVLPYFGLVVLVGAIIPGLIWMERRWKAYTASNLSDAQLDARFRREVALLWLLVLGLPFALCFAVKSIAALI